MRRPIRVLILHTSVGYGIKVTAQNIYDQLVQADGYEARIADFQKVDPGPLVTILQKIYQSLTESFPFVWGILYSELMASLTIPFRYLAASVRYQTIWKLIREFRPDIVISTQTVPSGIVVYLKRKGWYQGKLVIVFSDYHLHRFWLYDEADLYLCNIAEQREHLLELGIPEEKIAVTGMLVAHKYLQKISRTEACRTFGLNPALPAVLLSGGRRGLLASLDIVKSLLMNSEPFQIAVVTGLNEKLKHVLENLPSSPIHPLIIFGYVDNQDVLMSAVDVLISKPGGPTIAEAIAKGLSIVVTDAHPGHETANLRYLTEQKLVESGRTPSETAKAVISILNHETVLDPNRGLEKIITPQGAVSLTQALARLNIKI